jgi:hypothetical protein
MDICLLSPSPAQAFHGRGQGGESLGLGLVLLALSSPGWEASAFTFVRDPGDSSWEALSFLCYSRSMAGISPQGKLILEALPVEIPCW